MHDGLYEDAHKSEKWLKFSRTRTLARESFSEFFFNALALPLHKTDSSANLTMYQILRLMFFDQSTATSKILREDTSYDSKDTRQAIGDYLLGLDNLEARKIRQQIINFNKSLGAATGQVTAIHGFLGKDVREIREETINDTIVDLKAQADAKNRELEQMSLDSYKSSGDAQRAIIEELRAAIQKVTSVVEEKEKHSQWLRAEITDNEIFLFTLNERVSALGQSEQTALILENVSFKFCPLCLAQLDQCAVSSNTCPLCKHEHSETHKTPYAEIAIELEFQIRETQTVLDRQKEEYDKLCYELPALKNTLDNIQSQLNSHSTTITPAQAAIEYISKQIGHIEARIQQEEHKLQYARKLASLYKQKEELLTLLNGLNDELERLDLFNRDRDSSVRRIIERKVLAFVQKDNGDEKSFDAPQSFNFDFRSDSFSLDGKQKISDSSMVILKNSLGLALLTESTVDPLVRIPQFMLFDNIEDKGMREERSANFQRIIVEECGKLDGEFQIIMTTSMIDKGLDGSSYCVGPFYDRNTPTLDFSVCKQAVQG